MLTYTLVFASISLSLGCGSFSELESPQNNTSSFPSAPIDSSSTSDFSDNLYFNGSSSSSSLPPSSALQTPDIPHNIYSPEMVPVHRTASDPVVTDGVLPGKPFADTVFSGRPSSPVADNIFTSPRVLNQGIALIGANYPCLRNVLTFVTDGPETGPLPILQEPPLTLPSIEEPIITLSNPPVLEPRVISSRCVCKKTVVKPQIYQRTLTFPKIVRYLTRTVSPVVEKMAFKSKPITSCRCTACFNRNKATLAATFIRSTSPVYASRSICPCIRVF